MQTDFLTLGLVFLVASLATVLSRRARLPYAVGLVLAGLALSRVPLPTPLALSKPLVFGLLLPPLVFEAALQLRWPALRRDLGPIVLFATLGVLLAGAVTALGMVVLAGWALPTAIVFAALIAATDPVSVIATFHDAGIGGRLKLLVEAESLANDGTAAVLTTLAVAIASGAAPDPAGAGLGALVSIFGGLAIGLAAGAVLVALAGRAVDPLIEITLSLVAAYGAFHAAEHWHLSGILASVAAGIVAGNAPGLGRAGPSARAALDGFWQYVAFAANTVIFVFMGADAAHALPALGAVALVAILVVLAGRAVAVYPLAALYAKGPLAIEPRHQHVMFWGGLRGALALALALGLPETLPGRDSILATTFAVVLFSVIVQGLTVTPLLRRLGLVGREALAPGASDR